MINPAAAAVAAEIQAAFRDGRPLPDNPELAPWGAAVELLLDRAELAAAEFGVRHLSARIPKAAYPRNVCAVFDEMPVGDCLAFDDDRSAVQVLPRPGADTALLVFCDVTDCVGMKVPLIHPWFGQLPVSLVYLRDVQRFYYLDGVPDLAPDRSGTVTRLREIIGKLGATRTVCYGNSMGAFAALHYGLDLEASRVLGLGTPTNISPEFEAHQVARADAKKLRSRFPDLTALDLRQRYLEVGARPRVTLVFGDAQWDDRLQAERMKTVPDVRLHPVGGLNSHSILPVLIRRREFQPLLNWLVSPSGAFPKEVGVAPGG